MGTELPSVEHDLPPTIAPLPLSSSARRDPPHQGTQTRLPGWNVFHRSPTAGQPPLKCEWWWWWWGGPGGNGVGCGTEG